MIKNGKVRLSRILYILVGLLLCSNIGIATTAPQYVIAIIILFVFFISAACKRSGPIQGVQVVDYIPAIMIAIWIYGLCLGTIKGNELKYVVSNFAGLSLYILYYPLLYLNISKSQLVKLVFFAAYINAIYAFVVSFGSNPNQLLEGGGVESFSSSRRYYSVGLLTFFPGLSLIISRLVIKNPVSRNLLKDFIFVVLAFTCMVYLSASKGFLASLLFLIFIYGVVLFVRSVVAKTLPVSALLVVLTLSLGIYYLVIFTPLIEYLSYLFSGEEASNSMRDEQRQYLVDEFTLFGQGLGATLKSGYTRGDEAAYGFELSYENLVHKIGIFALIPFSIYIYTLYKALTKLIQKKDIEYSACALGAMMFLIPSYGNPMLFSPLVVMLHCLALYWLRADYLPKLRNNDVFR